MKKYDEFYDEIDVIKRMIEQDLIGPVRKDETIIDESPLDSYVMGILWPSQTTAYFKTTDDGEISEQSDGETLEDKLEAVDDTMSAANKYKPSTMGISFMLNSDEKQLHFQFSYGKYKYSEKQGEKRKEIQYKREEYCLESYFEIPNNIKAVSCKNNKIFDENYIYANLQVRKIFKDGSKLATLSISNTAKAPHKNIPQNEASLFQCKLDIYSEKTFLPVYNNVNLKSSGEEKINAMLYRNVLNYCYGHGCSAKSFENSHGDINHICSDFMPAEQVLQMMPGKINNEKVLSLKFWTSCKIDEGLSLINEFISEYEKWLNKQLIPTDNLIKFKDVVRITENNIRQCIERLKYSVIILKENNIAWEAFILMNKAMLLQRIKTKNADPDTVLWYPFQLAYILEIIPDIINPEQKYHEYVDLLWFPTGGGKTEAYLGVAAFTIFYRRLRDKPDADGVTVFMRYTLRLLTIQQFERATALICCCEYLRKKYNIPGGEINIGLWIGSGMTPNKLSTASESLNAMRKEPNKEIHESNPMQVSTCPWCGSKLDLSSYSINSCMKIRCSNNSACPFHNGLPIYVVDEDIYNMRPTLVLSTIDKFARITWEEKSKNLFGNGCKPPELIIQDELHLISGPLGSLAGIYETVVDALCKDKYSPKIIASTATVKNADMQIKNLYNRNMLQFPPNGFSADDSFFAVRASKDNRPARTYIGLCESGGSLADLIIRLYSNLIFQKQLMIAEGKPKELVDHFYTTVGYFNSIKDLGSSSSIIDDRMKSRIKSIYSRKFKELSENLSLEGISGYIRHDELTSRKTAKEIKDVLSNLEKSFDSPLSYSYILASNMLSVGIDINRLGVMTVYNQPKSNTEYIQATSRVGRQNPGLVFAMYNSNRSRDKSHYEQFSFYHRSFYQYVEATSVTPFSERSMEKALHCVFIAMVRHLIPKMDNNKAAANFTSNLKGISEIKNMILNRINDISPSSFDYAKYILEETISMWEKLSEDYPDSLVYYNGPDYKYNLLTSYENEGVLEFPVIMNSLRNVEESSNVYIAQR